MRTATILHFLSTRATVSVVLTESTSSTTPCKPKVFNMPRMANLGKAVPPVVVLVLLLSGQRMTTVKPESKHS